MKFLHLSDLHLGRRVNEYPMIEEQRHILEEVRAIVEKRGVDALLISGDLYDKATPSAEAVALLDWFLASAVEIGATVFCVWGNHDSAERVAYARTLLSSRGVHIAPVFNGAVENVRIHDEHGPINIWLLPFVKPATVRPHFPEANIATYTDAVRAAIESCNIDTSERNVCLSHQFVTYGGMEPERSDSEFTLGGMDNVDVEVYESFDYVALGHVHRPQRVKREEVRYSGSPLKYSLSEARDHKCAPLVNLGEKGSVQIELVALTPRHDLREIKGDLEQLLEPSVVASGSTDDFIKVVLTDSQPTLGAMERLRAVYPNIMELSYESTERADSNTDSLSSWELDSMSTFDLFEEFFLKQNGCALTDSQRAIVGEVISETEVV